MRLRKAGACVVVVATATVVLAAGGGLDTGFGTGGVATLTTTGNMYDGVAAQSDGKVVAVGSIGSGAGWLVARYDAAGALDTTFASGVGYVAMFPGSTSGAMAHKVVIGPDGRIYVGGSVVSSRGDKDFCVVRLNADGSLDGSFGTGGVATANVQTKTTVSKKTTTVTYSGDDGYDLALQGDGKVLIGGQSILTTTDGAVVRFTATGALDTTFGTGGVFVRANTSNLGYVRSVSLDANGGVLCTLRQSSGTVNTALIRLTSAGALDTSFGTRNFITDFGGSYAAWDMAVQTDGGILVSGAKTTVTPPSPAYAAIVRYHADGTPDRSYGTNGVATTGGSTYWPGLGLALQSDGKAVLAIGENSGEISLLARFDAAGALDASFGSGGIGSAAPSGVSLGRALAVDAAGRILDVGQNNLPSATRPAVACFLGN